MPHDPTPAPGPGQPEQADRLGGPLPRGKDHPSWRGGRFLASNGYVLVSVRDGHHLAGKRRSAYEHRLVAEVKIGRRLKPGEQVHHINGDKTDNRPENLEVKSGPAEHRVEHRKPGCKRRLPGEDNPLIVCDCGCGREFPKYDAWGRPRLYSPAHYGPDAVSRVPIEASPCAACGTTGGYIPKRMRKPTRRDGSRWGIGSVCIKCFCRLEARGLAGVAPK